MVNRPKKRRFAKGGFAHKAFLPLFKRQVSLKKGVLPFFKMVNRPRKRRFSIFEMVNRLEFKGVSS